MNRHTPYSNSELFTIMETHNHNDDNTNNKYFGLSTITYKDEGNRPQSVRVPVHQSSTDTVRHKSWRNPYDTPPFWSSSQYLCRGSEFLKVSPIVSFGLLSISNFVWPRTTYTIFDSHQSVIDKRRRPLVLRLKNYTCKGSKETSLHSGSLIRVHNIPSDELCNF